MYLPPGYEQAPERRYPSVYVIQGYTGQVMAWRNRAPFRQPFVETADAVFASVAAPPAIVVYVDAWTAYGGSQFVDSPGTGKYHSYLCDEVVPWVDARYRTIPDRNLRAIMGKSSGGFGSMITPMLRPDLFGALATQPATPCTSTATCASSARLCARWRLRRGHLALVGRLQLARLLHQARGHAADRVHRRRGGVLGQRGWHGGPAVRSADRGGRGGGLAAVAGLGSGPDGSRYADALRSVHSIWIDAGTSDDYFLDLGATAFRAELGKIGIPDEVVRFELFDATHAAIDYRYPMSLSWLCERMAAKSDRAGLDSNAAPIGYVVTG